MKALAIMVVLSLIFQTAIPAATVLAVDDLNTLLATSSAETGSTSSGLDLVTTVSTVSASAEVRLPTRIRQLAKRVYQAKEKIEVELENGLPEDVKVAVVDRSGEEIPILFEQAATINGTIIRALPPRQFRPGKYTLKVTDWTGATTTQDFSWGVLAINTTKSIYSPDETAKIHMAVLDDFGKTVCSAKVKLLITDPEGNTLEQSTETSSIKVNPACRIYDVNAEPDYEARYQTGKVGVYKMDLTAQTANGIYSVSDNFEVRDNIPFDIERFEATRIFPPKPYSAGFKIKINEDFNGEVVETVPVNFTVATASAGLPFSETRIVVPPEEKNPISIINAGLPFLGQYALSQGFGVEPDDPVLATKYHAFGVKAHDGADFVLPSGTPILAVDRGEVVRSGEGDYGVTAVVAHDWGKSYYGHLSTVSARLNAPISKGEVLGYSGSTGLSTGPHLHFGMKLLKSDARNGYFGKVDPLPYLGRSSVVSDFAVKEISWKVNWKKGDEVMLGYDFLAPLESPQFYLLGPLRFRSPHTGSGQAGQALVFEEARMWQVAADADGSGTNAVSPATGVTLDIGRTYVFTYTTGESVATGSGTITIEEPTADDWTVPQTSDSGAAGYTVFGSGTGTPGEVLDNADSNTSWNFVGTNACSGAAPTVDTAVKTEGTGDLKCINGNTASGRGFYKSISSTDWTNYTTVGVWLRASGAQATTDVRFSYDDNAALASPIANINLSSALVANIWNWETFTLTGTRNAIVSFGITCGNAGNCDSITWWADYFLIGPGKPTVSGTSPWIITARIITTPASTGTIVINYGGTGGGGVTNSATTGTHTFTTKSKIAENPTNALAAIGASPGVTLLSTPPLDQLMRHGSWFNAGAQQAFTF